VHDYVRQAVLVAKEFPGTPVKLLWSREEDMTHGQYHPVTQAKLRAGLDDQGNVTGFRVRISGQSILAGIMPERLGGGADPVAFQCYAPDGEHAFAYDFENLLVDHAMRNPHVPPGFWRGVNANQNTLYTECFVDELAHAAGRDPLEFRLAHMKNHPKNTAVLKAVAEQAGWGKPAAEGVYRGLAQCTAFASYIAACAEVSVTDGQLKVHRIVAATDCGYAVNPQHIEAQVEGSFVYGLSAMMFGECTVKDGCIEQTNFHNYPVMLIRDMPEVETITMPSGGFWGGVGEPTIAVAAPAVLNALFAATGKRIRTFPLKNHELGRA
jgi:isoquinoline 1-oxidoreductase beta subunit